jgi:hypothetical protein
VTARASTPKRPSRRTPARGARPSSSRSEAERDADFALERVLASLTARIREDLDRLRPAIVAGFEAGADFKLLSRASVDRLRARVDGAGPTR